jgi:murein DD-endopeptidase MepM/ murein hydrolase activator NlpD
VSGTGWARPGSGGITSGYGPRYVQCGSGYCSSGYHEGTDLGQACWSGIYAAQSGTVVYAGYNGGYGNYIKIDHGGGVATGYAHISSGGFYVGYGQWVGAGQLIAATGNTGNSFGCHLHFEVYINGRTTNPEPFMADRGIWL